MSLPIQQPRPPFFASRKTRRFVQKRAMSFHLDVVHLGSSGATSSATAPTVASSVGARCLVSARHGTEPSAPSNGRKTGTHSPKQGGRENPIGPTPWSDRPEIGPGPHEAVDLRHDDPRWVGVEPEARGGAWRDCDSACGVWRWVMGDRSNEHLAATLIIGVDRQHNHCRTVLGSFLAPLRRLGLPEVSVTYDEAGRRVR